MVPTPTRAGFGGCCREGAPRRKAHLTAGKPALGRRWSAPDRGGVINVADDEGVRKSHVRMLYCPAVG